MAREKLHPIHRRARIHRAASRRYDRESKSLGPRRAMARYDRLMDAVIAALEPR